LRDSDKPCGDGEWRESDKPRRDGNPPESDKRDNRTDLTGIAICWNRTNPAGPRILGIEGPKSLNSPQIQRQNDDMFLLNSDIYIASDLAIEDLNRLSRVNARAQGWRGGERRMYGFKERAARAPWGTE